MKKLVVSALVMAAAVAAHADVAWSWWLDNKLATPDVSLGLAAKCMTVSTFELTALYGASSVRDGVQFSVFGINDSGASCALQLAPWFNRGDDPAVQLGFINVAKETVFNLGLVNISDSTKVQLGFLNFNKNGLLPVFPFINLDRSLFD